jgi:myosin heavy subunit
MASIQINNQSASEEEKRRKHREAQKRYMDKQRMGWQAYLETDENLNNQIAQLNAQLIEKQASLTILQSQLNEKNTNISLLQQLINVNESSGSLRCLQLQSQLNESLNTISNLRQADLQSTSAQFQSQISHNTNCEPNLIQVRNQLAQKDDTINQLQQQISDKDRTISQLQSQTSQFQQQVSDKDRTIFQLQGQTSQLQQQNSEKDSTISQLQVRLSGCVTVDVDRRLQGMSQALANEMERQRVCLETISQLNSENASLKIFRDLAIELNDKFPKILPSFVNEIQQPGNQVSSPELNIWARDQLNLISPNQILTLEAFKNLSPVLATNPYPMTNVPTIQSVLSNPNIPYVSLLTNTSVPTVPEYISNFSTAPQNVVNTLNINHPAANDPEFQRWLYLYYNNMKTSREYKNSYQNLRNRYGIPPVQIVKQYSRS